MRNTAALAQIYNYMHLKYATPLLSIVLQSTQRDVTDTNIALIKETSAKNKEFFDNFLPAIVRYLYGLSIPDVINGSSSLLSHAIENEDIKPDATTIAW